MNLLFWNRIGVSDTDAMEINNEQRAAVKALIIFLATLVLVACGWVVAFAYWAYTFFD